MTLGVYDVAGRLVRTLLDGAHREAGPHAAVWDGRDDGGRGAAAGVYFYRLRAEGFEEVKRMVMVR